MSFQLSAFSHQLWATGFEQRELGGKIFFAVGYQLPAMGFQLSGIRYQLMVHQLLTAES
jgi:hypothetical protein